MAGPHKPSFHATFISLHLTCSSLEDNGVITDCSIKTLEPEALPDMNISNAQVPCNIIMKVGERISERQFPASSRPANHAAHHYLDNPRADG